MARNPLGDLGNTLGDYLREQRQAAKLSVRQLSELAGVSNPYLSQIERGLKRPSAEILQQLAKGLEVSAESLYVRAGLLDPHEPSRKTGPDTRTVIKADPHLSSRQKSTLLDIYDSFVAAQTGSTTPTSAAPRKRTAAKRAPASRKAATTSATGTKTDR